MHQQITVACVLRSGGIYTPLWAQRLSRSVQLHMSRAYRFVCLSDVPVKDVETIPLLHPEWPGRGWWSKLELFRPGLFQGPVMYFDLDTVCIGQLDDLPTPHGFKTIRDFHGSGINSSFMAWSGDFSFLYDTFAARPDHFADLFDVKRPSGLLGDQGFILSELDGRGIEPKLEPDGRISSYKWHVRRGGMPRNAAAVTFHGRPKPDELESESWIAENWPDPPGLSSGKT